MKRSEPGKTFSHAQGGAFDPSHAIADPLEEFKHMHGFIEKKNRRRFHMQMIDDLLQNGM